MQEDEIDLAKYLGAIVRRWRLILAVTVLVTSVALISSLLIPPTYEATALVIVSRPRYNLNFDPRMGTITNLQAPAYRAFPELATSPEILGNLFQKLTPLPRDIKTPENLRAAIKAEPASDASMLRLTADSRDADEAARIANAWADLFIPKAIEVYGAGGGTQVSAFQAQVQTAKAELDQAEQALVDFQGRDPSTVLNAQLDSDRQAQADYLAQQRSMTYLMQNIQGLRNQLSQQPTSQPTNAADQITSLLLQVQAYSSVQAPPAQNAVPVRSDSSASAQPQTSVQLQISGGERASSPLQLQLNGTEITKASVGDQVAVLDSLAGVLKARMADNETRSKELEPKILALQKQIEQAAVERRGLQQTRDVSKDTYLTLARKLEETQIAAQDVGDTRLGSHAVPPPYPIAPRKTQLVIVGAILGLVLGILGALLAVLLMEKQPSRDLWVGSRAPWKAAMRWILS